MIHAERRGAVALLTIDRQDRRNAVDAEACADLRAEMDAAVAAGARAVVLTGAGGHFCAGADLSGVEGDEFRGALRHLLDGLAEAPVPVVAAVRGAALGAGTQLAIACDLRMATPDARFGIPAAKLGLMVDHETVQRLVQLAGGGPARQMLIAAEEIDGERAHALGFVQHLGDLDAALEWAERIARLAPLTMAGHKLAANRLVPARADAEVAAAITRAWSSADLAEGQAAFRERRAPEFRGE